MSSATIVHFKGVQATVKDKRSTMILEWSNILHKTIHCGYSQSAPVEVF